MLHDGFCDFPLLCPQLQFQLFLESINACLTADYSGVERSLLNTSRDFNLATDTRRRRSVAKQIIFLVSPHDSIQCMFFLVIASSVL